MKIRVPAGERPMPPGLLSLARFLCTSGFLRLSLPERMGVRVDGWLSMKISIRSLLVITCASALLAAPRAVLASDKTKPQVLNSADKKGLAGKIGKEVSVEGLVQSVGKGDKDGVRFLDLTAKPATGFVAAIFPVAYKKVGPVKGYEGKNVRVTGVLEKYKNQTQIKVFKASQIKVLAAPKPTPAKKKS